MKYWDKSTKIDRYMWIWIANKSAKFQAKRLNKVKNIPKSFSGGGSLVFLNNLYITVCWCNDKELDLWLDEQRQIFKTDYLQA